MTEAVSLKPDLGRYGVWLGTRSITPSWPRRSNRWATAPPGSADRRTPTWSGWNRLWRRPRRCNWRPGSSTSGRRRPPKSPSPISASKTPIREGFCWASGWVIPSTPRSTSSPTTRWSSYLDELDGASVPTSRRVLAALGPKVLRLAAERSAGAHPYLTTPEHTAKARELVGNSVFLAPEHKVVLTTDADEAREIGRETVDFYLGLSNYVNNWLRLGFTDDDVRKPGSDKLIDAVVAYGTPEAIAARLNEHLEAGADHVAIQVLGGWPEDKLLAALGELAGPLGLTPSS